MNIFAVVALSAGVFSSFILILVYILTLAEKKLVGVDVVELAPNLDPTGNSTIFAAKLVRELILALSKSRCNDN